MKQRQRRRFKARLWRPSLTQIIASVFRKHSARIAENVTRNNALLQRLLLSKQDKPRVTRGYPL